MYEVELEVGFFEDGDLSELLVVGEEIAFRWQVGGGGVVDRGLWPSSSRIVLVSNLLGLWRRWRGLVWLFGLGIHGGMAKVLDMFGVG